MGTVPRDQALALGQEKAIAVLDYARATPELDTPGSLVEGGTLPRGKRVADASVRELREATTAVRKEAGKARRPSTEQASAEREASALRAWLQKRGGRRAQGAGGLHIPRAVWQYALTQKVLSGHIASDEQAIFTQPFDRSGGAALGSMDAGSQVWEGRQVIPADPQGAGAQEPLAEQTNPLPHSESWVHGDWHAEPT